jgi:hypothetical protein
VPGADSSPPCLPGAGDGLQVQRPLPSGQGGT